MIDFQRIDRLKLCTVQYCTTLCPEVLLFIWNIMQPARYQKYCCPFLQHVNVLLIEVYRMTWFKAPCKIHHEYFTRVGERLFRCKRRIDVEQPVEIV